MSIFNTINLLWQKINTIYRFNFLLILIFIIFFSIYRLVFWLFFNGELSSELIQSFYIGFKFDLRLAILLVLPILLFGWIKWLHPVNHKIGIVFWKTYLTIIFAIIILLYFLDFGHYAYLKVHLDKTIFRFAEDSDIALSALWQSYPIIWIILFWITLIIVFYFIINNILSRIKSSHTISLPIFKKILQNIFIGILVLFLLYGKLSWYPLRWVDAHFSNTKFIADLTTNPILYGFDTLRYADNTYDKKKVIASFARIRKYLKLKNNKPLNYQRPLVLSPQKITSNPNLVLVFLESFAAYKTGIFGNPLNSSPNFDQLAKNSLFFDQFYVSHTGTARSVFTNLTGIPDTNNVKTSTRNPLIISQNTLINAFKGYQKFYFLGGSANWGNIRGLLKNNIKNLKIYEEGYYKSPTQDVWGVSDADLFMEAGDVLKKQTKPFVAIIQTSGNHRPYTIPPLNQRHGFTLSKQPLEKVKQYGFASMEELNSFRFLDHSIGVFIKHAKKNHYYDNTIFVFYADHGIAADNGLHRSRIETELNLGANHIPLIIHAPKFIKPKIIHTIAGQPDMLPIVAGLMNKPYTNTTLGRNMLLKKYQDEQYVFTVNHGGIQEVGLIGKEFVFKMNADGDNRRLYDLKQNKKAINVLTKYPKKAAEMTELTEAIFETAKYLLSHNPNLLLSNVNH